MSKKIDTNENQNVLPIQTAGFPTKFIIVWVIFDITLLNPAPFPVAPFLPQCFIIRLWVWGLGLVGLLLYGGGRGGGTVHTPLFAAHKHADDTKKQNS